LYSVLFLFRKALIVKVFVWFSGLLAGAALWLFARRHLRLERRTSLLALTLFTLMPFTTSLHGITSADLLNLFFELLTLSLLWEPRAARRLPIAALAGVFGGLSLGTRPYSLMWVLALALLMTLFDRRFKETFVFLFVAGLVYCPWPLRDLVWTGNPFYPVALWKGAAADPYLVAGSGHAYANLLSEFIRLPLFLSSGPLIWGMGVLPFALAPMAFCEKDKNLATWRLGFLTILILILTMALPFRNARYFGQAFPLLALFGAMGFENFEAGLSPAFQKGWRGWILLMLVVPNLAMSVYFGA
jgi:hypothetical protein